MPHILSPIVNTFSAAAPGHSRFHRGAAGKLLRSALLFLALALGPHAAWSAPSGTQSSSAPTEHALASDPFLNDLEERTFRFFWDTANPKNGLIPDRYPTPSFASIAAVGFGLTAYPIGVQRGYVSPAAARKRVLATLRFFAHAQN